MSKVILDWDPKYQVGIITSNFLDNIRARFSIMNPAKKILARKGFHFIPDRLYAITETGRFEIGLFDEIYEYITKEVYTEFEVVVTDNLKTELACSFKWNNIKSPKFTLDLRSYQKTAVEWGIQKGRGLFIVGTAGGKTLIMASLAEHIRLNNKTPSLILLPANLVEQTYKEFLSYGISDKNISKWSNDSGFVKNDIIIASIQTVYAALGNPKELKPKTHKDWLLKNKDKSDEEYKKYLQEFQIKEKNRVKLWKKNSSQIIDDLSSIDTVIIDEVHSLRKGNELNRIIDLFNTKHKYGFTGTLPESKIDEWNIIGKIGSTIIDMDSAALRDLGYISPVTSRIIKIHYKEPPKTEIDINDPTAAYVTECAFLYKQPYRNSVISHLSQKLDNNVLIMVDKIEHGETLYNTIRFSSIAPKQVFFIQGSVEMDVREQIRDIMEKYNNVICIAISKIFSTGVNIKNLHYIIFAQGGKAKITMIQSIGRGLRLHKDKEKLVILDIADMTHYGKKHLDARIIHYEKEQIKYESKEIYESGC